MSEHFHLVYAKDLAPGDVCAVTADGMLSYIVMSPREDYPELLGSGTFRFWCRLVGTGREGWRTFTPDGITYLRTNAFTPAGGSQPERTEMT